MKTIIVTDSNCDLNEGYLRDENIVVIPFHFTLSGIDYEDNFGQSISYKDFYDKLRAGEISKTAQIAPSTYEEYFVKYSRMGYSIIYIGFSSVLSESFNHSMLARNSVQCSMPNADISVIDSKSASVGQGLLVSEAANLLKNGKSKQEIVNWIESTKLKVNHWFTVDSLEHLKRGGRLSATSAAVGTILSIKPILIVDSSGKLVPVKKVRGRKQSIRELFVQLKNRGTNFSGQTIYISHGDCIDDAEYLSNIIARELNVRNVVINYLGPIIGTHTGPGLLCLAFMGENREGTV